MIVIFLIKVLFECNSEMYALVTKTPGGFLLA